MLRHALLVIRSTPALKRWMNISANSTINRLENEDDATWLRNQSAPILQNIFKGYFNYELFEFPDIESAKDSEDLQIKSRSVEQFMTEEVDSNKIDQDSKISNGILDEMKSLGMFGFSIPTEYGGLGFNLTKQLMISENLSSSGGITTTIMGHESCGAGILIAGSEEQKRTYLPKLAAGETIGALCLTEQESGSDAQMMQTTAVLAEDGSHYRLNGTKTCVINGAVADVMVVFAKTKVIDDNGNTVDRITAFIVEQDFGGIQKGDLLDMFGCRGSQVCSLTFVDTKVPVKNVLGEIGEGFQLSLEILNAGRLSLANYGLGIMKHMLKGAVNFMLSQKPSNQDTGANELIKHKIGRITAIIYAIESMTYLTAGLKDEVDDRDFSLETAAVKIFSSEATWNAASECLQILGNIGYLKNNPYQRLLRDARYLSLHGSTNEILRLLISGSCIKQVGLSMSDELVKLTKPKEYLGYNLRRSADMYNCRFRPVDQNLQLYAHEDLAPILHQLSLHTNHFRYIVPEFIAKYGRGIIDEQMLLSKLADNAIDIYGISSVVGRATRSLLRHSPTAPLERDLAYSFCMEALDRIHLRNMTISFIESDADIPEKVRIADTLLKFNGYAAQHALTRNW